MAIFGTEIVNLPSAAALSGTEIVPIVQNGITSKTTISAIGVSSIATPQFLTLATSSELSNERVFGVSGSGLTAVDGGAGGSYIVSLAGTVKSVQDNAGTGIIVKPTTSTVATRSLVQPSAGITISNADGVGGNPTFALADSLASLQNLSGVGGIYRTGTDTLTLRSITGTSSQITVTNGDGVSGAPTISIASNPAFPGTGGATLPQGTTAQRSGSAGTIRWNTTLSQFEGYDGSSWAAFGAGSGSGTVTSVSVVTANGVSGSVANATTTPAITLTLGDIVPTSVASVGSITGSNLSGTNTGDQTITLTGDVTGSGTGSFAATIANDAVTYAKIQNVSAASKLLGRGDSGSGDVQEITLGTNLTMSGTTLNASGGGGAPTDAQYVVMALNGTLSDERVIAVGASLTLTDGGAGGNATIGTSAFTGDITTSANSFSTTITNNAVTFAKFQQISTDRLIGRDTAATGNVEELTVGGGIEFTGTGGIQTSAFTGDATKSAGGTALTLATVNSNVGSFGSATQVGTFTVNGKGLITAASNTSISIASSAVTDFTEAAQDAVGAMIDSTLVYVDATPSLGRAAISGDITISAGSNTAAIATGVIVNADINASAAIDATKIADGSVTSTEFQYINTLSSNAQTQLDAKQPLNSNLTTLSTAFASASASGPASLALHEDTDNGTNKVTLTAPASVASDKTITFQDITGTVYVTGGTDVAVADGGTGLSSGTSGGIPYFSGSTTMASSGALTDNVIVLGGGGGNSPTSLAAGLGTTTTLLHGNASGEPTWGAVSLTADVSGTLPVANGGTGTSTAFTAGQIIYAGASGVYTTTSTFVFDSASSPNRVGLGTNSPQVPFHVYVDTNGTNALMRFEQDGVGDSIIENLLTATVAWIQGIDNSDGDKFKWCPANDGFASSKMELTTGGIFNLNTDGALTLSNQTTTGGASTGTLTNAPSAGNPAVWLRIAVNGTTYKFPGWT